jgi:hypothetical protein
MGPEWIGFVTAVIAAIIAAVSQIMLFQKDWDQVEVKGMVGCKSGAS